MSVIFDLNSGFPEIPPESLIGPVRPVQYTEPAAATRFRDPAVPLTFEQREHRSSILKHAEHDNRSGFAMSFWEHSWESYGLLSMPEPCTTTRCIAGWSDFLKHGKVNEAGIEQRTINDMGLTYKEYFDIHRGGALFYTDDDDALERLHELVDAPHEVTA